MNTTTDILPPHPSRKRLPESQRSTYQFPVYRWINWLAVAGYGVGLVAMFFLSTMIGIPAAILWPFFVVVFCVGVALLGKPRALLDVMMFYFLLMPGNRLFGLLYLPLPNFIDELFFVPFIAVIFMNLVQGRTVKGAGWFPLLFGLVTLISWYVNGKQMPFSAVKILLVNLKFFIIWYFCRLTLPFKNSRELFRWCWLFIGFAALQFAYNTLWQRAPWPRFHPDLSGGVFGPDSYAAHVVGYISVIALFLLGGWSATQMGNLPARKKLWVLVLGAITLYDLVFMTDTKHVLVLAPVACAALLFLPGLTAKFKIRVIFLALLIGVSGWYYLSTQNTSAYWWSLRNFWTSPKGQMFKAVTVDFPKLVNFPVFGAGPGLFASIEAVEHRTPLARRYITPYSDEEERRSRFGMKGTTIAASVAGALNTDFFFITSEFGWLGECVYLVFWVFCVLVLYRKGVWSRRAGSDRWGIYLGLSISLILFMMLQLLTSVSTVACLSFPIWMLVGRIWDMPALDASPETLPGGPGTDSLEGEHAA